MALVFATFRGGFGDLWAIANYLLHVSEETGEEALVFKLDSLLATIVSQLNSRGAVREVDQQPDVLFTDRDRDILQSYSFRAPRIVLPWLDAFGKAYFPTRKVRWYPNRSRIIATQLVPRNPDDIKACSPADCQLFRERSRAAGYEVVELGLPRSIEENIAIAARCEAFVGVCSGMSHLCHSVGVPVHLVRNKQRAETLERYHRGNQFTMHSGVSDAVSELFSCEPNHEEPHGSPRETCALG
jgi:hypothetical protein